MFIAKHRRFSQQPGCGVQYIPGHIEPFVDLVLKEFLPPEGDLLDLGGGGLRFALPVALGGRAITVVDLDGGGLDVGEIVDLGLELLEKFAARIFGRPAGERDVENVARKANAATDDNVAMRADSLHPVGRFAQQCGEFHHGRCPLVVKR